MALLLENFLPYYPSVDSSSLQGDIYRKKEFYNLRLEKEQEVIQKGEKLNHQLIIARYFSEYTNFDEGLLYHQMGTGKTCAVFALTESLKNRKAGYKKCIILARGDDLLKNLMKMLVFSCSDAYSIDFEGREKDERFVLQRIKRAVKDFYMFQTFYTFAKDISLLSEEQIEAQYSNCIFIVDEVQNIKGPANDSATQDERMTYSQLHRLFHSTRNRKILLLSATPMKDNVYELADVMNLILPSSKQLPTGKNFDNKFLTLQPDGTFIPKNEGLLKEFIRGRISYLSEPISSPVLYLGKSEGVDIPQFRSVDLQMGAFQSDVYSKAYRKDTSGEEKSIYTNSRQASLFVFPDGSWGAEGLATYTKKAKSGSLNLSSELVSRVNTLEKLRELSVKYAHVIETIKSNPKKNVYVYSSMVNGSGANLLSKILEIYGYEKSRGNEPTKGKRYILLTSGTPNISRLLAYYNDPKNRYGEYCQVIIGSKKIAEGFSFSNILIELILTLHWNDSETAQAAKRGARYNSWNALLQDGIDVVLSISKVCAIPEKSPDTSIDKLMLSFSKRKDISSKRVDRIIKEVAFDCPLTYERNVHLEAGDFSRDCDYGVCEYKCDGMAGADREEDISTYELYYSTFMDLVPQVKSLFKKRDVLSYQLIRESIRPAEDIQLLKALAYVVFNNVPLLNRYRSVCYLREYSNYYYLSQDITTAWGAFVSNAVAAPVFTSSTSLDAVIEREEQARTLASLDRLDEVKTTEDVREIVNGLSGETRDFFIKSALEAKVAGSARSGAELLLKAFKPKYTLLGAAQKDGVRAVYKATDGTTWCLKSGKWALCVAKIDKPTAASDSKYSGLIGETGKFCIRRARALEEGGDKRKVFTGSVCEEGGWRKGEIVGIMEELKVYPEKEEEWKTSTKKQLCAELKEWFNKNSLLEKGNCGTARKKRV